MPNLIHVFWEFFKLGCRAFGGPVAHIMYFREVFVERLAWLDEREFLSLVSLCQTLPGPASSQVGFAIGVKRAGVLGGAAAFVAFTLPSVLLLLVFANYLSLFASESGQAILAGLMIVAFAVVLHGIIGMAKTQCASSVSYLIALLSFISMLMFGQAWLQILLIGLGAFISFACNLNAPPDSPNKPHLSQSPKPSLSGDKARPLAIVCAATFWGLFVLLPVLAGSSLDASSLFAQAQRFYLSGALVFGGGHVVLPLLEQATVAAGHVSQTDFLAGYGATQAMPGPMFSFAAFLGYVSSDGGGVTGALIATSFVFLPGFLLVLALLPFWQSLAEDKKYQRAIDGANAAVIGLLAAALYDPIFIHAINDVSDVVIAALAFSAMSRFKLNVLFVVLACVLLKLGLSLF